jgi:hypothetical protein
VYSKTKEQPWEHLRALFSILAINGLALNLEKCVFAVADLDFLSHPISAACVTPSRTMSRSFLIYLLLMTARHCKGF